MATADAGDAESGVAVMTERVFVGAFPVGPDGTVFTIPLDVDRAAAMIQEAGEKADREAAAEAARPPGRGFLGGRIVRSAEFEALRDRVERLESICAQLLDDRKARS